MFNGRKLIIGLVVLALIFSRTIFTVLVFADIEVSHDVTVEIRDISSIRLDGGDVNLIIDNVSTGNTDSMEATDSSCSLSYVISSSSLKKITAELEFPYPTGITLYVAVTSESGQNLGEVELTNNPTDVIRGLRRCIDTNQTITYRAVASIEYVDIQSETRTVTYTIADQ